MRNRLLIGSYISVLLILVVCSASSCSDGEYKIFTLGEGIAHFSMEYPSTYEVVRIDIRNDATTCYTDVGLRQPNAQRQNGLREISVYAWPIDSTKTGAAAVLDDLLDHAGTVFKDFELLNRYSIMVGDREGQLAIFSWTAAPATYSDESEIATLPALSRIVCFCHRNIAWEIHVASDSESQEEAEAEFGHIIDSFRIRN
jgi:hypothetical protein